MKKPSSKDEWIELFVEDWTRIGDSLEDILEGLQEQPFAFINSPPTEEERRHVMELMAKFRSKQ